jgi:hypothetical protein
MGDKLRYHLKKAELYGLLAKKYKYKDPHMHCHFYKKHYYHTQCVDRLYMASKHGKGAGHGSGWESSGAHGSSSSGGGNPGIGWPGMGGPGMGSPGMGWSGMGSPGAGGPGMGWSGAGREE